MKLSKNILKSIVKECMIEILSEGLDSSKTTTKNRRIVSENSFRKKTNEHSISDVRRKITGLKSMNLPKKDKIKKTKPVINITNDPVLNDILSDTASTTLKEQFNAEKGVPVKASDAASLKVANSNLEDLFGNAAGNWSKLAFPE